MAGFEVAFPKPCGESWDEMRPAERGRDCASCGKMVHNLERINTNEVERLLDREAQLCVRARVRPDGSVTLANDNLVHAGKMTALAGAALTMTLTTAACQTPFIGPVSQRYEITGEVPELYYSGRIELRSAEGRTYKRSLDGDRKFRITNLKPGEYTLVIYGTCTSHEFPGIIIRDSDVDAGTFELPEPDCIIIGHMTRESIERLG